MLKLTTGIAVIALAGCSLIKTSSGGGAELSSAGAGDGKLTMPDLIGKTPDEARALVKAAGFAGEPESSRPVECENAAKDPGKINCQDPEAGKLVARSAMIQVNVYEVHGMKGIIVRGQLATLKGLTLDQAKQQLKKLGHDGEVTVAVVTNSGGGQTFVKGCGDNRVCEWSGESGISIHDGITLYTNPKLSIASPPD